MPDVATPDAAPAAQNQTQQDTFDVEGLANEVKDAGGEKEMLELEDVSRMAKEKAEGDKPTDDKPPVDADAPADQSGKEPPADEPVGWKDGDKEYKPDELRDLI